MNENQHDASVNVQMAQAKVNLISEDLTKARRELRDAEKALDSAIRHDPASWYATPGVKS